VKIDPSLPPADASEIQRVTPSDIYSWPGPDVPLTQSSDRTGIENNWFALTGRVVVRFLRRSHGCPENITAAFHEAVRPFMK
jgi:hypothetical protein